MTAPAPAPEPAGDPVPADYLDLCPFCDGQGKPVRAPAGIVAARGYTWIVCLDCGTAYTRFLSELAL